jgi:hypothetical protein
MSDATTVAALAQFLSEWPRHGAAGRATRVLIASPYPDLCSPPAELIGARALETDDGGACHLVLQPRQLELPGGCHGPNATAVDLALAALQYAHGTPMEIYDPAVASELVRRAIEALTNCKALTAKAL